MSKFDHMTGEAQPEPVNGQHFFDRLSELMQRMSETDRIRFENDTLKILQFRLNEAQDDTDNIAIRQNLRDIIRMSAPSVVREPIRYGTVIEFNNPSLSQVLGQLDRLPNDCGLRVEGLECAIHWSNGLRSTGMTGCPVSNMSTGQGSVTLTVHSSPASRDMSLGDLRSLAQSFADAGDYRFGSARNGRHGTSVSIARCRIERYGIIFVGNR